MRRSRFSTQPSFDSVDFRSMVKLVFAAFRKQTSGVARMNIACCGGCASSELASIPSNHGKACVFLHAQDQEGFDRGVIHVEFGIINAREGVPSAADTDVAVIGVGQALFDLATKAGLWAEWDGTPEQTVILYPTEAVFADNQWDEMQRYGAYLKDQQERLEKLKVAGEDLGELSDAITRSEIIIRKAKTNLKRSAFATWPAEAQEAYNRDEAYSKSALRMAGGGL